MKVQCEDSLKNSWEWTTWGKKCLLKELQNYTGRSFYLEINPTKSL